MPQMVVATHMVEPRGSSGLARLKSLMPIWSVGFCTFATSQTHEFICHPNGVCNGNVGSLDDKSHTAYRIQSAKANAVLIASDFRLTGREGRSIPSSRSCRSSATAARIRGTKTAARTPATSNERHGSESPIALSRPPTTAPRMRNHRRPQATSRLRFGGIPSSESGGQDCHSYFLASPAAPPVMSTQYAQRIRSQIGSEGCVDRPAYGQSPLLSWTPRWTRG